MGRAIVIGTVIVVALMIAAGVWMWTKRHDDGVKGDLGRGEEREMRELIGQAAMIFMELGPKAGLDDSDFLSEYSKKKIRAWITDFNKKREDFDRA